MDNGGVDGRIRIGRAEDLLFELAEHSADCVTMVDLDGRILVWNPACERQYGWSIESVAGRELPHVPPPLRRRTIADLRRIAASGEVARREAELQRADGSRFLANLSVIPVSDADGHLSGVMTIVRDSVSDRRLERQREALAEMVALHLKAPLSDMLVSTQLMRRPEVMSDPKRRDALVGALDAGARRALRLVEDLATLAAIERGELQLSLDDVDLAHLISSVIGQVEGAPSRVQLDFEAHPLRVSADPRRLGGALAMLLGTALRVTPADSMVGVSLFSEPTTAVIEIRDLGPARPDEGPDAIFSSFYTGSDPRGETGARMGLFVVRGIVEAHSGSIEMVPTSVDAGAVTRVRLPFI